MKKALIILTTTLLISGCGIGNKNYNTSYYIGENAIIDHFKISCRGYELINEYNNQEPKNGIFLKVDYKIISNNDNNVLIKPENFFKLYDGNEYVSAIGNEIILEKDKEKEYTVIFDTSIKNEYKVIFYSNVVSNNIAFEIK